MAPHPHFTDLETRANGFLRTITQETSRITNAVLVTAQYDETAYADSLFERLTIPRPATLSKAAPRRLAEYLAGRAMTQAAMACLGHPVTPVLSHANRAPIWPAGLSGSISHARGRCACLLSQDTNHSFGLDTEAIAKDRSLSALLSHTLCPDERAVIAHSPFPTDITATLAFSAKETLFKALFPQVGRYFGFDAALMTSPPDQTGLSLTLSADLTDTLPKGRRFDLHLALTPSHVQTWLSVSNA